VRALDKNMEMVGHQTVSMKPVGMAGGAFEQQREDKLSGGLFVEMACAVVAANGDEIDLTTDVVGRSYPSTPRHSNYWNRGYRPGWPTSGRHSKGDPDLVPVEWPRVRDGDSTQSAETKSAGEKSEGVHHDRRRQLPYKVLLVRGRARLDSVEGIVPEYAAAAERYFGREQGQAWVKQLRGMISKMVRIAPEWVGLLDFQTRFPSALSS